MLSLPIITRKNPAVNGRAAVPAGQVSPRSKLRLRSPVVNNLDNPMKRPPRKPSSPLLHSSRREGLVTPTAPADISRLLSDDSLFDEDE